MDASEVYYEQAYKNWLYSKERKEKDQESFQRHVKEAKGNGAKGGMEGKIHVSHFVHFAHVSLFAHMTHVLISLM
jgi:hypothetical protein